MLGLSGEAFVPLEALSTLLVPSYWMEDWQALILQPIAFLPTTEVNLSPKPDMRFHLRDANALNPRTRILHLPLVTDVR